MKTFFFKILAAAAVVITLSSCDTIDLTGPGLLEPPTFDAKDPRIGFGQEQPFGFGRPRPGPMMGVVSSSSVAE